MELFVSWFPVLVFIVLSVFAGVAEFADYRLTVLHTNDIHAKIEEFDGGFGECSKKEADNNACFGGYARIKTKVDEIRSDSTNTILLDGGDQYMGTLWFYFYKGPIMAEFMNMVKYNAMGLGNHEFDDGPSGLKPFLDKVTFKVLSCNINTTRTPEINAVASSTVITVGGQDIGVIGYTTKETVLISNPGEVIFYDEITSIQEEVNHLIECYDVNKIIAVGHAGYEKDLEIAKRVTGLDVIVGGHTNTFLYNGQKPHKEDPKAGYPTIVTQDNGDTVLVVQDFAYGKYLGKLDLTFNDQGTVKSHGGNPILLDHNVKKDKDVMKLINFYRPKIEEKRNDKIGKSLVFLKGDRTACRFYECNMGNLIADAMVHQNLRFSDGVTWSKVTIAVINAGGIRADIKQGPVTVADALQVQPFSNSVEIVKISGQTIRDLLEHSALHRDNEVEQKKDFDGYSGFLQMSGLRVQYNQNNTRGERVVDVQVLCADCLIPQFKPLNLTEHYMVLMQEYLIKEKRGTWFSFEGKLIERHTIGTLDVTILMNHIKQTDPITTGLDGRISVIDKVDKQPS